MWYHVLKSTDNKISEQPTVCTFLIGPSHSLFLLFHYPEDGGSRHVGKYHKSFQKFPTWPQHMWELRSAVWQHSWAWVDSSSFSWTMIQEQLQANWRSACQMHVVIHLTPQMTDGVAKIHSFSYFDRCTRDPEWSVKVQNYAPQNYHARFSPVTHLWWTCSTSNYTQWQTLW